LIRATLGLLLAIAIADPAFPQGAGAAIAGTISGAQQAVLPGVTLILRNAETGITGTAISKADDLMPSPQRSGNRQSQ